MQILPSQKSTAGFNILDSFQSSFSSSKGGDLFADLLKYSATTSASLPALAPAYADPLQIAPSSSTVSASSARLEEPSMPASHADDSLRNVKMSREDYAGVRDKLEQAGVSKEKLEESIYGWGEEVESNAVEFIIHALRRKLGSQVIRNVRGLGWRVSKSE